MKIAFIGQKGIPTRFGGIEKHVEELAVRLAQKGHQVFVYCRKYYVGKEMEKFKGVNLIFLPSLTTKNLDAITHTFFASIHALFGDYDIIHYHGVGPSTLSFIPRLLKPGVKVVNTFHCRDQFHAKWGKFARAYLSFGEFAASRFSHQTIAVSRDIAEFCQNNFTREAVYIPNGVDAAAKPKVTKILRQLKLKRGGFYLAVARLVPHKNIHLLISAFQKLKTDKKLVIVGDSTHTDEYVFQLKKLAAGNRNIIFSGWLDKNQIAELYKKSFLFIHPSKAEGLPIVVLEAMERGAAALLSNVPEHVNAFGKRAFYFKNDNLKSLLSILRNFEKNPVVLNTQKVSNQRFIRRNFNWDDIVRDTEKLYAWMTSEKTHSVDEAKFATGR